MDTSEFLNLIKTKKQTIAVVVILFILFAVVFTFIQPMKYSSEAKLLVVQKLAEGGDPAQISRSNQYVATLLASVVGSNTFLNDVLASGFNIDKSILPRMADKRMKTWKKMVHTSADSNGIISLKVFQKNREQAREINEAIIFVIKEKHEAYHGFGDMLSIKTIEDPLVSSRPVKPNIFVNIFVALAFGLLCSLSYIYLFGASGYSLRIVPAKRIKPALREEQSQAPEAEFAQQNDVSVALQHDSYEMNLEKDDSLSESNDNFRPLQEEKSTIPANLPLANKKVEYENNSLGVQNIASQSHTEIKERGSMDNIIKQTKLNS